MRRGNMSWTFLVVAGLLEVLFTTFMRYSEGFTRPLPTLATLACAALSLYCVVRSTEGIPLGTAYAAWGGIGAAGTVLVGVLFYGEPVTAMRFILLGVLVGAIAGLKLVD